MKTIQKIYLTGLGAIGSSYAGIIYENNPDSLKIIANNERINRYSQRVTVNKKTYLFNYIEPDMTDGTADLIIIAVKQHHLEQCIQDIKKFVGPDTIILSLLNGITSEEIIGQTYGMDKLLYSFVVGTDAVREGTATTYSKLGKIVFGEKTNIDYSPKVRAVKEYFDRVNIPYEIPQNMLHELWWKFMLNVGINQTSAILKAPYRVFQTVPEARELMVMASREVIPLSLKTGVDLCEDDIERYLEIINTLSPDGKTSMLQDVEAKRKTEVEIFAGTVIELGRKYRIETPVNDILFKMIRTLEQSYL